MKKSILFLVFSFFLITESVSQFSIPIQDWANAVESRVMVVQLKEENPKELKKLQKKGGQDLEDYKRSILEHNGKLKELIPKYWLFGNTIEFKPKSEVEEIVKLKDERYMIMDYRYTEEIRQSVKVFYAIDVYALLVYYPEYGKKLTKSYLLDDNDNGRSSFLRRGGYIFKVSLPESFLNDRDMKFALCQFKDYIERAKTEGMTRNINRYGFKIVGFNKDYPSMLKNKTLLIPEELLVISEQEIKNDYKHAFKIAPFAQIDSLLMNDLNNEYAYYNIIWSDKGRYFTLIIIDNATGKLLAENPTTDKKFQLRLAAPIGNNTLLTYFKTSAINFVINSEHLKKLTQLLNE